MYMYMYMYIYIKRAHRLCLVRGDVERVGESAAIIKNRVIIVIVIVS